MSNAPPGRKQVHSFADLARLALSKGIASAKARPGPEDLDHYERLCNELLARLGALYPLEPWKVKIGGASVCYGKATAKSTSTYASKECVLEGHGHVTWLMIWISSSRSNCDVKVSAPQMS